MKLITCEFNMDSGCVELRFDDGTAFDINCTAVEDKCGYTIRQRRELEGLVYNAPLEYAKMVLQRTIGSYLLNKTDENSVCVNRMQTEFFQFRLCFFSLQSTPGVWASVKLLP